MAVSDDVLKKARGGMCSYEQLQDLVPSLADEIEFLRRQLATAREGLEDGLCPIEKCKSCDRRRAVLSQLDDAAA